MHAALVLFASDIAFKLKISQYRITDLALQSIEGKEMVVELFRTCA